MSPVRQRPGIKTRKHALGPSAALSALLLTAACTPAPTEEGTNTPSGTGGSSSSSGSGGKPSNSSGSGGSGSSSSGSGGSGSSSSGTGGSGSSSSGSGGSGSSSSGTGGGGSSSSGTGGTTGTDAGGGGSDAPTTPTTPGGGDWPAPCTTEPAATVPPLKATPIAKLPGGDQAGQVVGVPGEKGIYVIGHRTGKVYYVVDGKVDPTPMAQVTVVNNPGQDEQGLLGIALHPKFKDNQLFYLFYTTPGMHVEELKRTGMTSSMRTRTIWDKPRTNANNKFHNGGQISFSVKDNGKPLLYHSIGNNSSDSADAPEGIAGRILIHDLEAGTAKTLGHGLRNPYRMHIDRLTGDMYVGETNGPAGGTIRFSPFASPVTDYGFPKGGNQGATVPSPFAGIEGSKALIGGVVYRGSKIPAICGRYFYAGWPEGALKSLVAKDGKAVKANVGVTVPDLASFGEDGEGEIYMSSQNGEISKLEAM